MIHVIGPKNSSKDLEKKSEINVLQGDLGNEFNNYELKQYCKDNNITLDLFKSDDHKLGIINRWHRTIKEKLTVEFRLMTGDLITGRIFWQDHNCICIFDGNNEQIMVWKQAIAYMKPFSDTVA